MSFCEICGKETDEQIVLPIHQDGGKVITLSCLDCALKTTMFCHTHKLPYFEVYGGGAICPQCVRDHEDCLAYKADWFLKEIREALPMKEYGDFFREICEMARLMKTSFEDATLHLLVIEALRAKKLEEEIVGKIVAEKSARTILIYP